MRVASTPHAGTRGGSGFLLRDQVERIGISQLSRVHRGMLDMTRIEHALSLYDSALALVREKGRSRLVGSTVLFEYNLGLLTIRHRSEQGSLDVWFGRNVLTVERWGGKLQLIRYEAGSWERDLSEAAKLAA